MADRARPVARKVQVFEAVGERAAAPTAIRAVLKSLEAERVRVDKAIDQLIEASPAWCAKQDLLKSVPGIGNVAARTLIAKLPELGQVDRHQIAAPGKMPRTERRR